MSSECKLELKSFCKERTCGYKMHVNTNTVFSSSLLG